MAVNKIFQVFISATYLDLIEARSKVFEVFPDLRCLPVFFRDQEHADERAQWQKIRSRIDECDYVLLLLGSRYGTLTASGISRTHQEVVYARHKQKPVLVLMHDAPAERPPSWQENSTQGRLRFQEFRADMAKGMVVTWREVDDLAQSLRRSLPQLMQARPARGWVAATAADENLKDKLRDAQARITQMENEREQWLLGQSRLENLAQGQDKVDIAYQANVYAGGHCEIMNLRTRLSWNELFLMIAPHLGQPQPEAVLHDRIAEALRSTGMADAQQLRPKAHAMTDVRLSDLSFSALRVQLRSLGLITRLRDSRAAGDPHWQLTALGEQYMTRLLVVANPA